MTRRVTLRQKMCWPRPRRNAWGKLEQLKEQCGGHRPTQVRPDIPLRGVDGSLVPEFLQAPAPAHHPTGLRGLDLQPPDPRSGQYPAQPADPGGSPAILPDHEGERQKKQCGQTRKGHGGPLGAQLSRRLPDGPGQGGGGETDPRKPRCRVQAPAHQREGDAGADPGGDAPVPHSGQGGGDVRALPAGPDYRDAPGRVAGPPVG